MEEDYEPGQEVFYHEDGDVLRVEVVTNNSDGNFERYELKVKEILRTGPFFASVKVGQTFPCEKRRNVSASGLWHLLDSQ